MPASDVGLLFVAIAVIFLGAALRDYLNAEGKLTPARRTWIRMAFIFSGVGISLYVVQTLFQ